MEAWKDELYHYGVKGMKWRKRKMSKTESDARNYETNARRTIDAAHDVQNYYNSSDPKMDMNVFHRKVDHMNKQIDSTAKASKRVAKIRDKHAKKLIRYGGYSNLVKAAYSRSESERKAAAKKFKDNIKNKTSKKVRRRVAAIDAKNKAKAYVTDLFKKR